MRKICLWIFAVFIHFAATTGPAAYAGSTVIVSVGSEGKAGKNISSEPAISADGRYVAFWSIAGNFGPDNLNNKHQIFVHDMKAGSTEIASLDNNGSLGNDSSGQPAMSADGRFVAFFSAATNLVPDDKNENIDVFVRDLITGATEIMSVDGKGNLGNDHSGAPAINADGRFVAFQSAASNLVAGDKNERTDIFVRDIKTGATEIISMDGKGSLGNDHSRAPAISADGRFVAFYSAADNLVPNDTNKKRDIFVRDRKTGLTEIVSVDSKGKMANDHSGEPSISADGKLVAFRSTARNLVPNDANDKDDIFVRNRQTRSTNVVSVDSKGRLASDDSGEPAISADGRFVAFESNAANLVPDDVNGSGDVFIHDRRTGVTKIISVSSGGVQQIHGGRCFVPAINGNGMYIAFESEAGNLVTDDMNGKSDVFVRVVD